MAFKKINTADQNLQLIQDNIDQAFGEINVKPFLNGNLISGVSVASGNNPIAHGLRRRPQMWVITDQNAGATFYRVSWDENYLTLHSSGACTISVWVA